LASRQSRPDTYKKESTMNTIRFAIAVLAMSASTILPLTSTAAEPAAVPAAARFYPFVGNWKGQGELREGEQPATRLTLDYQCKKASAGWAVSCNLIARNGQMTMAETDLFGVDPVTGKGHWFAVTNAGETHNHIADWTDSKTMTGVQWRAHRGLPHHRECGWRAGCVVHRQNEALIVRAAAFRALLASRDFQ